MELKHYLMTLLRWWWLVALVTAASGGTAYLISQRSTPIYESSTTLLINQVNAENASIDLNALRTSEGLALTYVTLLVKRPVMEATIANLNLPLTPQALTKQVEVTVVRDTQLLVLTVEDRDPQRAADIANEIVRVFSKQNHELLVSRYASSKENFEQELERIRTYLNDTQKSLDALAGLTGAKNATERERLQALLADYTKSYATALNMYETVRLAEAQVSDNLKVVEEATPSAAPVRPKTVQDTGLALIVGAMLGVMLVLLIRYLDRSVHSSEQIELLIGAPTLGSVGRLPSAAQRQPLVARETGSQLAEAYSSLAVNLELSAAGRTIRSIVLTSCRAGEGKTLTAANLAVAIALTGKRVALIDADLRQPGQHALFGCSNERGLTTLLSQPEAPFDLRDLQTTVVDRLWLLPSGPLSQSPVALLSSRRMADLMAWLSLSFDAVLIDTPPLFAVADAPLLARHSDATLLVVRAGQTQTSMLKRAKERCDQAGMRLYGAVFNAVSDSALASYPYGHGQVAGFSWRRLLARQAPSAQPAALSPAEPKAQPQPKPAARRLIRRAPAKRAASAQLLVASEAERSVGEAGFSIAPMVDLPLARNGGGHGEETLLDLPKQRGRGRRVS